MNRIRTWIAALPVILFCISPLYAQETEREAYQSKKVILPFMSYTPETSLMGGGLMMVQFKPLGAGIETRASQLILSGIYSLNRQLMIELTPNVILDGDEWLFEGRYEYSFFPDNYWGVGPFTGKNDEINVEFRSIQFQQAVLKNIGNDLYTGLNVRWVRLSGVQFSSNDGEPFPDKIISGRNGSRLTGAGFSLRHDKRNSITYPTEKHYLELSTLHYPRLSGSSHPHSSFLLDARKYYGLKESSTSVLAFHFQARFTSGNVPFQEYSLLGGREIMRGYFEGRFRDANAAQIQAEWRQILYKRIGMAVFVSGGEVWNRFKDFNLTNPKYSGGAGLRFNLNPNDTNNLRIDYGIGKHGSGIYITIGEAF